MKNIVIFASGNGSNAENIVKQLGDAGEVRVAALFCNNPQAGVIARMEKLQVPVVLFDRKTFRDEAQFNALLAPYEPDLLVLAGFLWLVPEYLVKAYSGRIINIHPALLPKFGGKGMYGHHVHEAVIAAGEKEHGITIHFVNEQYDEGTTLFQAKFEVSDEDTPESVAKKIALLEMQYFPEAILRVLSAQQKF